jgi:arylsulfatase A-like enzyme
MTAEPNILFVCSDQERRDTCDCYGQLLDIRPNLDGIAREGVRFEHAFTPQLVCGPARACPQTGKYATETGRITNDVALPRRMAHA